MSTPVFRFARVTGQGIDWQLRRNCSATPVQLGWFYGSLCVLSLGIGFWFWQFGVKLVMAFAGLELLAVGAALVAYARHAADGERIRLVGGRLLVELEQAGRLQRAEFNPQWVRVEPQAGDRSLIELSGQGRTVAVGRFMRPELRPALASEIRKALRAA